MSEASEKSKIIVKPLRRGWHRFSLDIAQEREIARKHGQLAEKTQRMEQAVVVSGKFCRRFAGTTAGVNGREGTSREQQHHAPHHA